MGERFPPTLPDSCPPTTFQFQQHEEQACSQLPWVWSPRRPIAAVRNGWPELPELTPDQLVRFGGGLYHTVRRLYAAIAADDGLQQKLQVELMDTVRDLKVIAAAAPLEEAKDGCSTTQD